MKRSYMKYFAALLLFGFNGIVASFIDLSSYEIVLLRTFIGNVLLIALFFLTRNKLSVFKVFNPFHAGRRNVEMCVMDTSAQFDELYHAFDNIPSFEIRRSRLKLSETAWHLTPLSDRMVVTYEIITGAIDITYRELFCDFRSGGYRILGDIICDLDEMYRASGISDNLIRKDDSEELQMLLTGIDHYGDYKQILIRNCMTTVIFPKKYNGFTLQESYGLRTFWDSQQNQEIQKDEDWQKR